MRILLDECLPRALAAWLSGYDVTTVQQAGWTGIQNGRLLDLAEGRFDLFLTADKRIKHQQNLKNRMLAGVVLPTNRLPLLPRILPELKNTLARMALGKTGQYFEFSMPAR